MDSAPGRKRRRAEQLRPISAGKVPSRQSRQTGVSAKTRDERGWAATLDAMRATVRELRAGPALPKLVSEDLTTQSWVWREFPTQEQAFGFCDSTRRPCRTFSYEAPGMDPGKRRFIVTTYHTLTSKYFVMRQPRHLYEVIRAGAPCKLYLDLEFRPIEQPSGVAQPDGPAAVARLLELLCARLNSEFPRTTGSVWRPCDAVVLDSSSPAKFSQHVVFPAAVFANNAHIGVFVSRVVRAVQESNAPADAVIQAVRGAGGEPAGLVDLGVYTRNRNFRLYRSSKLGKSIELVPAPGACHPLCVKAAADDGSGLGGLVDVELLLASLVCNVSFENSTEPMAYPSDVLKSECSGGFGLSRAIDPSNSGDTGVRAAATVSGQRASPFSELDRFIIEVASVGGVQAGIRRWVRFAGSGAAELGVLTYDILHNRYCHRIERPHRSNGVLYVVNLDAGVYYQKCHDPDCRAARYMSNEIPIPEALLRTIRSTTTAAEEDEIDMEAAIAAAEAAEADETAEPKFSDADLAAIEALEAAAVATAHGTG